MPQGILVTLITLLLYAINLVSGGPPVEVVEPQEEQAEEFQPGYGVVEASELVVRDRPDGSTVVATLQKGDSVSILSRTGDAFEVRLPNGQTGWVSAFGVRLVDRIPEAGSAERETERVVLGYYVQSPTLPSMPSFSSNVDRITTVVPWTWEVTASGDLLPSFDARDLGSALGLAGANGVATKALVHNARNGTFDGALIGGLLQDEAARKRLVERLYEAVQAWGMSGVHVDFENVPPGQRYNLTRFMAELRARFAPAGLSVSMAVPAKTYDDRSSSWSGAFDYGALAEHVDLLALMTYDEHWAGGPPGPVASIGWVERVVRFALHEGVPSRKIVVGIAAYGYDWPPGAPGRARTYSGVVSLASRYGAVIRWHDTYQVPYFYYGNGGVVWFENRESLRFKLALVRRYDLAGISLWRLGQEDPGVWTVLEAWLQQAA